MLYRILQNVNSDFIVSISKLYVSTCTKLVQKVMNLGKRHSGPEFPPYFQAKTEAPEPRKIIPPPYPPAMYLLLCRLLLSPTLPFVSMIFSTFSVTQGQGPCLAIRNASPGPQKYHLIILVTSNPEYSVWTQFTCEQK